MSDNSQRRVKAFMEMTASKKKTVKKSAKTGKDPKAFHDKTEERLNKLAKKHGVSISLRRNKTKMSNIVIGKLRKKPYGEVVKLFNEIAHTSPVPQRMVENGASFRLFGPRKKVTASEETFEEYLNRLKTEPKFGEQLSKLLADASDNSDDNTDESDDSTDDSDDSEESDDGYSAEDEANKADIVKFINDNKISKDVLNGLIDKASNMYIDDMKTNAPVEDVVDFVYNVIGPDDVKTALKAAINKTDVTASTSKVKARRA